MAKTTDDQSTKKTTAAKTKVANEAKPAKTSKNVTPAPTKATPPKTPKAAKTSPPTKAKKSASKSTQPGQEMINGMVAVAAYFLAEKRNFAPGFEEQDWLAAKEQIMSQLAHAKSPLK